MTSQWTKAMELQGKMSLKLVRDLYVNLRSRLFNNKVRSVYTYGTAVSNPGPSTIYVYIEGYWRLHRHLHFYSVCVLSVLFSKNNL